MNNPFISLLFPSEEKRASHALPEGRPNISDVVCDEIGLSTLLDLRGSSLSEYFTVDEEVIRYREATIADMIALPRLGETLTEALPILYDITELRRLDSDLGSSSGESYLYSITEIELYVGVIDVLFKGLSAVRSELKSEAFAPKAPVATTPVASPPAPQVGYGQPMGPAQ